MRRLVAVAVAVGLVWPGQATACQFTCFDAGIVPSSSVASRAAPRSAPKPTARPIPAPAAVAASLGLHAVTQVWAGDVVSRAGAVTTYTTVTAQQNAGTFARQVASVTTGQRSAYDAVLSNGRTTLSDGRAVSGDIYANYVWTGTTLRLDRYVFFQDDREVARPTSAPVRTPAPTPIPTTARPTAAPALATPQPPRPSPTPAPPRAVAAGIALAPQGDVLPLVEVLRGRRVDLWPRATVDGAPARVASWRLVAGELTALGAVSGSGDQPFGARWDTVRAGGAPYEVRLTVVVDVPGQTARTLEASIRVTVRAPAVVE